MSSEAQTNNSKKYINPIIVVILMLLGHVVPAPAPITEVGIGVLFTFIGMIYGWSTCGMLWPSLLGVAMLGFTGYVASPEAALGLMLTNTTFVASLVGFILFAYIAQTGLMDVIANWVVTRKFAAGKPWMFMSFLFLALALVAPYANMVVLIILGFNFVGSIMKQMGYTKEDTLPTYMMIGVSLCGIASVWTFFMPGAIFTNGIIATATGGQMLTGFQYTMCIAVPLFISIILYLIVGKFILRIDTSKFVEGSRILQESSNEKTVLTDEQKKGAIVLVVFILGMVLPAILPKTWVITALLSKAGIVGVCIITTVAILILCRKDGSTLAEFPKLLQGVNWDIVVLTGGIMVIANALISGDTGIVAFVSAMVIPMLSKMSLVGFTIGVAVFMCIISQFSMNMVLQMIFAPILAPILLAAGHNPMIAVMAVYLGTQFAYLAPSGSMMAAMVFGNTEWVTNKQVYKICIPWIVLALVMSIIVSLTFPDLFCANLVP